jgi:F-type H+-transporting ATPase subunit b
MLIDWFTVGAQALNFLILVWLMKRFLYKPILNAIDAREKRIAKEHADANAMKAEAKKERDDLQHKNESFDQLRASLLKKATDEANTERQRLLDEANKDAETLSVRRHNALITEAHNLSQTLSRQTQREVFAIARKVLSDLATASLEEQISKAFTNRLNTMDDNAKHIFVEAVKTASEQSIVRSAFDLPAQQQMQIQQEIDKIFPSKVHIRIRFETAPDLVSGIELITNGQKVSWNIADYLTEMEKGVGELLKGKDKPKTVQKVQHEDAPEHIEPKQKTKSA